MRDSFHKATVPSKSISHVINDVDTPSRLKRSESNFSEIAIPTALDIPCPKGPVVVSTPGVIPYSGWPGVFRAQLPKVFYFIY